MDDRRYSIYVTLIILIATRVTVAIGVTIAADGGGGGDDAICAKRVSRWSQVNGDGGPFITPSATPR